MGHAASACARAPTSSTFPRSRASPVGAATVRRRASRARIPSRRSPSSSSASSSRVPPRGRRPSGLVLVDKPAGPSSFAIVAGVRRRTGARTGHAGTLDPFATGLLLLLSGAATKLASCFVGLDKRYRTDVDLRARTSTGDPEGEVVERLEPPPSEGPERRLGGPPGGGGAGVGGGWRAPRVPPPPGVGGRGGRGGRPPPPPPPQGRRRGDAPAP